MLLKFSVLAVLLALTLFCAVSAKQLPACGEYARDTSRKGKTTTSRRSGKKGKNSKKAAAKKPTWLDVPIKLPIAHVIQAKKNDTKIVISKVMKKLTFEGKKQATQVMKKLLFSAEKQTLKLLEEPKKQLKELKNTVYKAILAEIDSSIDKVIEKLQKPCENDGSVSLLGVKISNCKINVQSPTSKDWSVKLSGSVSLLDKFAAETEVSIVSGSTTVVMKFTRDFNIQNLLPFLAGTPIAAISLEDVQLIIASSDKNDFDLSPGLHFVGTIAVDGSNQVFSFIKPFVSFHDRIKAKLSVSGESSLSDLLSSSGRDIALQFGIKELQLGSVIQCSSASIRLANFAPTFSIQAQCGIKIGDGSSGSWKLELEKTKDGKLAISGSLSNTIEKALGIEGFTIDKASIGGAFANGAVSELKVRARLNFGNTQMDLVGDISQSIYSVTISNVSLGKALEWFKFGHLSGQLPKISLSKVEFLLHLKNKGGMKLRISAETSGSIFDHKYTALSMLDIQKDRVEIATKLKGSLKAGPITVAEPTVKVIVRKDKPDREVSLSGTASFWKLKNLDVNVAIANVNGQTGFAIVFKLGDSFRLSQAIPVIKGTPFDVLEFQKPAVQISSYPIAGIDGTLRKGIVFKASLKFGGAGAMGGLKMLFGSITVPIDLAIGSSLTNIDPKRLSIISAIEFSEKKSGDFIFHSPIGLNLAFAPPAFGVKCEFTLKFPIDKQPLRFRVSMALDPLGAEISGESLTEWRNPFGLKGFTVKKLAIDVGIVYAIFATTGVPTRIGGIGSFILPEVGEVTIATLVDLRKMETILHAKIDRLTIGAIFGLLKACGLPLPSLKLPEIGLRNAELYVAPNGGKIASVEYERGFTFMTEFWLFNSMFGKIKIQASPTSGFSAYAKTSRFQIGPLSVSDCVLDMKATTSAQHLYLYGSVSIKVVFELFKKHIEAQVTKDRMYFKIEDLFFAFEAQCRPDRPHELTIAGKFKMDFINNIGKALGKGIDAIGKGLDKLESKLGKLKSVRDAMMNKLKSIKIPSSCGNTLAYEGADETQVMFFRRWRRAFRRVGRAFRRAAHHVRRGASRGFHHVRRGASRGFRHVRRGASRGFRHVRRGVRRASRSFRRVSRGFRNLRRSFKRLRGLGRRFGRKFGRFGRKFGRKFGRFARGAGRFAKKAGRTIGKHAKNVGKHAVRIAKKAGHELKKAALKMCNLSLKAMHKAAAGVKKAAKAVNKAKDAIKKYAKKYVVGLLKGDLFSLESIRFEANLANVMKSGALRVEVRVKIMGKRKKFGITIGSVNNVKSIVKGLMKKLIGK